MSLGTLTDRLRGIVKPARALLEPGEARPGIVPDRLERPTPAPAPRDPTSGGRQPNQVEAALAEALDGRWADERGAPCYVVERRLAADTWHGRVQVGALAETLRRGEREAPLLANGAPARLPFLFFDLETTGLSGGAGTYAFLVGVGWFEPDGAFVTRQYVLTKLADERSMLAAVAARLGDAGALVSFNGRSYDAPLLESRFLYHRLAWTAGRLPHVDVLHPARRFWRQEAPGDLASCSLGVLERAVLGATRLDDVPGFEAPSRYFRFVRSGDPHPLTGVLEHNRLDLVSLAGLTARLLHLVTEGAPAAADAREAVALGRLFERAGMPARAVESFERALTSEGLGGVSSRASRGAAGTLTGSQLQAEAIRGLAHLARRGRRFGEAADRWRALLELPGCPRALVKEAAEALAVHHEHRVRDLAAARSFAMQTLDAGLSSGRHQAVRRRLERLERKLTARAPADRRLFVD